LKAAMPKSRNPRMLSKAKQFAQVDRISLLGIVARMWPVGLWVYANAYLRAATAIPALEAPYELVRYYLACHSIELSLKAYLSLHGATMVDLSESAYGHNLDAILTAAEKKGLQSYVRISAEQRAEICKAATYYAGKVFEYPAMGEACVGYPNLPKELLFEAATLLVDSLA
jgi:hypothetical protein